MYSKASLRKFAKNNFIISKNGVSDRIYKYDEVINVVERLSEEFQGLNLPQSTGIAVKFKENFHTFGSVSCLIALLNYGCFFCPLPEDEFSDILPICGAKFLLSNDEKVSDQKISYKTKADFQIFEESFTLYNLENCSDVINLPKNMCYTIGTSGSTGKPKMVHVPYECIAPNIHALCSRFKITSEDNIFLGTPLTFDPFIVELFMALLCGATLIITTANLRLAPEKLHDLLWPKDSNELSATVLQTTPSLFRHFGVDAIRDVILTEKSALRILVLGGEDFPKPTELKTWLPENGLFKKRIFNVYGITEISCWSTIHELKHSEILGNNCIPIGEPIDDVTLRIIESTEGSSNGNIRGELLLGSETRRTYIPSENDSIILNTPNETFEESALFRRTMDLVERNQVGEIYYIGRLNNTIKRLGKRICLDALELKIEHLLSSIESTKVVCLFNPSTQSLVCCLQNDMDLKQIKSFTIKKRLIIQNLLTHEKPDEIIQVESIPLNKHGKIDRKKLLDGTYGSITSQPLNIFCRFLIETLTVGNEEPSAFNTSNSKRQKLDYKFNGITESFTALGGTSFHALSLATEIGKYFSNAKDQRQLLQMLLDPNVATSDVLDFLKVVQIEALSQDNFPAKTSISSTRELSFLWRVNLKKCVDATPALNFESRYLCIGSHASLLITVDTFNGKEISRMQSHGRIECEAVFISSNLALVGCNAGYLYAFQFLTGEILWSMYFGCKVKAKPLAIDGTHAIIGCYDDVFNLVYVCIKTQNIEWRKKVGKKPIYSSPLRLDNQTALICSLDGIYERVNIQTGSTLWSRKCETPIFSTPAVVETDETFSLAEVGGKVHICQIKNGDILHSFTTEGNIFSNMTIHKADHATTQVIFGCHDYNVYCLNYRKNKNENNISLNWKIKMSAAIFATPVVAKFDIDHVVVISTDGVIGVLVLQTGSIVVTKKIDGQIFSTPCCFRSEENEFRISFGCRDNYLYCFKLK